MQTRRNVLSKIGIGLWFCACLILALGFGGCAAQTKSLSDLPTQEFTGYYTSASGQSWFRASDDTNGTEPMWVTFTGHAVTQVEQARAAGKFLPGHRYFVHWRAAVITSGEVGPRGAGSAALLVRELLEFRPAPASDGSK